jgi:hypothetical protein
VNTNGNFTITGNANFGTLTSDGSYVQTGGNLTATSMSVSTLNVQGISTIGTLITAGDYVQTGGFDIQSATVRGNTRITGSGFIGAFEFNGDLTQIGTLNANSITSAGNLTLSGSIITTGNQVWTGTGAIILVGNSTLAGGNITIARKTYSSLGATNYSLTLRASNDVVIANDIGTGPGITRSVNAALDPKGLILAFNVFATNSINLLADVSTQTIQSYTVTGANSSINIGSVAGTSVHNRVNWGLSGSTGYDNFEPGYVKENNPDLVRTLISVNPTIEFNGPVNDVQTGTHSLVLLAIARTRGAEPKIIFGSSVGAQRKLYSVSGRTMEYLEGALAPTNRGTIFIGGSISTVGNQTYQTGMLEVTGNSAITISSESGKIRIVTPAYRMNVGISFEYSFSNPPEISNGPGLIRLADKVKDVPTDDFNAGTLSKRLLRMAVFTDESDDSVEAEVEVGDINSADEGECIPTEDGAECEVKF